MASPEDVASSVTGSLPSTSEIRNSTEAKKHPESIIEDSGSVADLQTWSMCPMGRGRATVLILFVCLYSFLFLFFASRSTAVLITMTGLIAVWIVSLYITGAICVLYMMLQNYPPPDMDEINGMPFSKLSKRVSLESSPNTSRVMEVKF